VTNFANNHYIYTPKAEEPGLISTLNQKQKKNKK